MAGNLKKIKHFVVAMLENRSFDNLLGFLYAADQNQPPRNLPAQAPPTFEGLLPNQFWNPGSNGEEIFASAPTKGASPFTVPNPDPNESFANMTFQIFGTRVLPVNEQPATMQGFYADYLSIQGVVPAAAQRIMESYCAQQVPVLSTLAKNYAVCDRWFASVPAQTWPNRAFVHAGTSRGEVVNGHVFAYNTKTIFDVLEERGVSWAVYNDSELASLARIQYPHLLLQPDARFRDFGDFKQDAAAGTLPAYAFVEPRFLIEPNDQHPPHDVAAGEQFILDVWNAVSTGPRWNETLLVITYDEHGGCFDHVPPPWGAAVPDQRSNPGQQGFHFNRFGVRVPAVVVSPLIEPGTVFRSPSGTPYDHTSILATLRDWLSIPPTEMLPSRRIGAAPTLEQLLSRDAPREGRPAMDPVRVAPAQPLALQLQEPLNHLQQSMVIAAEAAQKQRSLTDAEVQLLLHKVRSKGAAHEHLAHRGFEGK